MNQTKLSVALLMVAHLTIGFAAKWTQVPRIRAFPTRRARLQCQADQRSTALENAGMVTFERERTLK